jgi:hypothetical protein
MIFQISLLAPGLVATFIGQLMVARLSQMFSQPQQMFMGVQFHSMELGRLLSL